MMFPLGITFTVFDVETTGLSPAKGDRIIEIAGVRVKDGTILEDEVFTELVNPERSVPWEARRVNQISDEELFGAPTITEVLPRFLEFAEGSFLVAHNADFDYSFLTAEKEACWGFVDIPECLCTMKLSRSLFPAEYRHNLDIVSQRLGLTAPECRHRALPDVLLTAQVLLRLIEAGHVGSLDELRTRMIPKLARTARSR